MSLWLKLDPYKSVKVDLNVTVAEMLGMWSAAAAAARASNPGTKKGTFPFLFSFSVFGDKVLSCRSG